MPNTAPRFNVLRMRNAFEHISKFTFPIHAAANSVFASITCALADNSGVFMDMVETVGGKDNSLLHPSSSPPAPKPMELPPITTIIATSPEETSDSASSAPTVETPATSPAESAKLLEATADDPAQAAVNASNAAGGAAGGSTFRVVVLCKLHNPVSPSVCSRWSRAYSDPQEYVEAQKVQQSAELQKKVAGIPVGAPLKVKTSGGVSQIYSEFRLY